MGLVFCIQTFEYGFEVINTQDATDVMSLYDSGVVMRKTVNNFDEQTVLNRESLRFNSVNGFYNSIGRDGLSLGNDRKITYISTSMNTAASDNSLLTEKGIKDYVDSSTNKLRYIGFSNDNTALAFGLNIGSKQIYATELLNVGGQDVNKIIKNKDNVATVGNEKLLVTANAIVGFVQDST